jgi:methionyl aminopeptidase
MAIILKSAREIEMMRRASQVVAGALKVAQKMIVPGVSTAEIDRAIADYITGKGCAVAFKGLYGYPANACISINEQVVHGIPGPRKLVEGDIVSIDVGAGWQNYFGDAAKTFPVGRISGEDKKLLEVCSGSLDRAIEVAGPGVELSRVSAAVQQHVEAGGFSVVRKYVGHGIGLAFHEEPQIPNFVEKGKTSAIVLKPGMTLAIEPMINAGGYEVVTLADGWTVVTADGSKSAHFEHTVLITADGVEVLTKGLH